MADFIARILRSEKLGADVVHVASLAAEPPSWAGLAEPLPEALAAALRDLGIDRPYSHQAEAIDRVRRGEDVLVVTPTASGKSLVYLVPTFESALLRPGSRALYLFPFKALAQDQLQGIEEMAAATARRGGVVPAGGQLPGHGRPVSAAIYDGDTSDTRRRQIKADPPDILITNPDMLHLGILAHHDAWRPFFENLDFVVVDELHVYRGIFGSHLHHILKRLHRVAGLYGRRPRFIASSATVASPGRLGEGLAGRPFSVVEKSGAPRAARTLMFLNPHGSPYTAAATLFSWALDAGYRTIAFTKARKITELLHSWLLQTAPRWGGRVSAYRSGYLPEERREIERRLFRGDLQGVISTSALELGVDIGGLDVCLLVGYPGSIVSSWQRIGRVGREDRPSLTVLIGMPDALDQYFMTHPDQFLSSPTAPSTARQTSRWCAIWRTPARWRRTPRAGAGSRCGGGHSATSISARPAAPTPSTTRRPGGSSAASTVRAPSTRPTPAPSTCTTASSTWCATSTSRGARSRSSRRTSTTTPRCAARRRPPSSRPSRSASPGR
jgi:DEAD/DEAH box helicase domain-containing protein